MKHLELWNLVPELVHHVYIKDRKEFFFSEETYSEWVLFTVEEGIFNYQIGEITSTATKGDVILCPPGVPFIRKIITPLSFHFFKLNWSKNSDIIYEFYNILPNCKILLSNKNRLLSTFTLLREFSGRTDTICYQFIDHLLKDIWQYFCAETYLFDILKNIPLCDDKDMNIAFTKIKENAFNNINLKAIATSLGFTHVQFTRKFYTAFNITPVNLITEVRLEKAKKLLINTNLILEEVAVQCGYDNGFYFSRIFTQKLGLNPSKFRKMHRL